MRSLTCSCWELHEQATSGTGHFQSSCWPFPRLAVARGKALEGTNHELTGFRVHVTDIWPVSRPLDVNPM